MKGTITTIFWDVDNTLLDFDYSCHASLRQCFRTIGKEITDEMIKRYTQINNAYWKRLENGEVTKEQLLHGRFADFFTEYGLTDIDVEKFRKEYQRNLGNIYSFKDDSLTICKSLQTKYKQYVVTNGVSETQRSKLNLSGFAEVMNGIFISEEIGSPKPSVDFFTYCLEHIEEKDKSKILLVGDSLTSDIQGANAIGIKSCWYNPQELDQANEYHIDYEITDLHQIYEVLDIFNR